MTDTSIYFKPLVEECQRYAVSAAYDVAFEDTPAIAGLRPEEAAYAWTQWATERGMRWWRSDVVAPVGLPRWLAQVQCRGAHEVAMTHDRLWRDTTGNVSSVRMDEVQIAGWLWPAERRELEPLKVAPINGHPDGMKLGTGLVPEPGDVNRTVLVYPADRGPTTAERPQPRRVEKVGRNDPCPCGSGTKYKRCCGR